MAGTADTGADREVLPAERRRLLDEHPHIREPRPSRPTDGRLPLHGRYETETTFRYCWRIKSSFKLVWMESTSPCNSRIGYLLVEVALLLIGLAQISFVKLVFDRQGGDQSSFRLSAQFSM